MLPFRPLDSRGRVSVPRQICANISLALTEVSVMSMNGLARTHRLMAKISVHVRDEFRVRWIDWYRMMRTTPIGPMFKIAGRNSGKVLDREYHTGYADGSASRMLAKPNGSKACTEFFRSLSCSIRA